MEEIYREGPLTYRIKKDVAELVACDPACEGAVTVPITLQTGQRVHRLKSGCFCGGRVTEASVPYATAVERGAFDGMPRLERVSLGAQAAELGPGVFSCCPALQEVSLARTVSGSSLRELFQNCPSLRRVQVGPENRELVSIDGVVFRIDLEQGRKPVCLVFYPCGRRETVYQLPEGVCRVGDGAICDCPWLEVLQVSGGTKRIWLGEQAIARCANFRAIRGVEQADTADVCCGRPVTDCPKLDEKTRAMLHRSGEGFASHEDNWACYEAWEKTYEYQLSERAVLLYQYCRMEEDGLQIVGYRGTLPERLVIPDYIENEVFEGSYPEGDPVEKVCSGAFAGADIAELCLGDCVFEVEEGAFAGCKSLRRVSVGRNLGAISPAQFKGCDALSRIEISEENLHIQPDGQWRQGGAVETGV